METKTMGKVSVAARLENFGDAYNAATGHLPSDKVRTVEVTDALIDTGASGLLAPRAIIDQLGLLPLRKRVARTMGGTIEMNVYRAVRLSVQGRDCVCDVSAVADDLPVVIGQLPLEAMDWVVDLKGQRLIGNPEHGGEQMIEALSDDY
jgi:predicted aspartyl protease